MKKKGLTNAEVLRKGEIIEDWAVDTNPKTGKTESNAGKENLVVMPNGKVFTVITDFEDETIFAANKKAKPIDIEKGDFIAKALKEAGFVRKGNLWKQLKKVI
jgi:hypothetical protein